MGFVEKIIMNFLFGEEILMLLDKYLLFQSDLNKVLIVYGVSILSLIGIIQIVKSIIAKTIGIIRVVLLLAVAYYILDVVLGVNLMSFISNS